MTDQDNMAQDQPTETPMSLDKGKGKAVDPPAQDVSMDEDEESSEEEEVCSNTYSKSLVFTEKLLNGCTSWLKMRRLGSFYLLLVH